MGFYYDPSGGEGSDAPMEPIYGNPTSPGLCLHQDKSDDKVWWLRSLASGASASNHVYNIEGATINICWTTVYLSGDFDPTQKGRVVHSWVVPKTDGLPNYSDDWQIPDEYYDGWFFAYGVYHGHVSDPTELVRIPTGNVMAKPINDLVVIEDGAVFGEEQGREYWNPGGSTLASRLSVKYTTPSDLAGFAGVKLFIKGHLGANFWQYIADDWYYEKEPGSKIFQVYLTPYAELIYDVHTDFNLYSPSQAIIHITNYDASSATCDLTVTNGFASWTIDFTPLLGNGRLKVGDLIVGYDDSDSKNLYEFQVLSFVSSTVLRAKVLTLPGSPLPSLQKWRFNRSCELSCVSMNASGRAKSPDDGKKAYVVLDAISSPPNSPSSVAAYETELGVTLKWPGVYNEDVATYMVYRNTSNSFYPGASGMEKIAAVPHDENLGSTYSYHFTDNLLDWNGTHSVEATYDTDFYYCVKSLDKTNLETEYGTVVGPVNFRRGYGNDMSPSVVARDVGVNLIYNSAFDTSATLCPHEYYSCLWNEPNALLCSYNGTVSHRNVDWYDDTTSPHFGTAGYWAQWMRSAAHHWFPSIPDATYGYPYGTGAETDANSWTDIYLNQSVLLLGSKTFKIIGKDLSHNSYPTGPYGDAIQLDHAVGENYCTSYASVADTSTGSALADWKIALRRPDTSYITSVGGWLLERSTTGGGITMYDGYVKMIPYDSYSECNITQYISAERFYAEAPVVVSFFAKRGPSNSGNTSHVLEVELRLVKSSGTFADIVRGRVGIMTVGTSGGSKSASWTTDEIASYNDGYTRYIFRIDSLAGDLVGATWADVQGVAFRFRMYNNSSIPLASSQYIYITQPMINLGTEVSAWTNNTFLPDPYEIPEPQFGDGTSEGTSSGGGQVGGGDPTCVYWDTPVMLANGKYEFAIDLDPGMELLAYDVEKGIITTAKVLKRKIAINYNRSFTLDDGMSLRCTESHRVYANGEWKAMKNLKVGDKVLCYNEELERVESHEIVKLSDTSAGNVVKLELTEPHTFIAGRVISHNIKVDY